MRSQRRIFSVVVGPLLVLLAPPASAQSVRIPGTSVTMTAPAGFRIARGFNGLENPDTGSSIKLNELPPESESELAEVFSSPKTAASRFAYQGVRITRLEQISLGDRRVPLAIGEQVERKQEFRKYIAVVGGASTNTRTTMITFDIADTDPLRRDDVEAVLRSIKLTPLETLEQKLAKLSFRFEAKPPFHTRDVLPGGTAVLASFDGIDRSATKPIIMIVRASTSAAPAETAQTAERVLRGTGGLEAAKITETATAPFADGQGQFISAAVEDRTAMQYLRVLPGGTYLQLLAVGETGALEQMRGAVEQIASSVALSY